MKKYIIILLIILIFSTSCSTTEEESDVAKILPYNEEQNQQDLVQIFLPNRNLSCITNELTTIKDVTKENYIDRALEATITRSLESNSFIDLDILNIVKTDEVDETVFLTIEWKEDIYLNEKEECLILYSLVNTAAAMDGIQFVKIINGDKDFFNNKYYIGEALSPSNTILYKDYVKPINTVDNTLNIYFKDRNVFEDTSEEAVKFLDENISQYIGYNIKNFYYNQYNSLLTVNIDVSFYNESYVKIDRNLSFLLEYINGKFRIREIYEL
ncbi:MAG: hypothetical protein ACOCUI_04245 [bacterium]